MRRVAGWGALVTGILVLAGFAATRVDAGTGHAPPTVTVYKTPT
jgi:hypothetical protein